MENDRKRRNLVGTETETEQAGGVEIETMEAKKRRDSRGKAKAKKKKRVARDEAEEMGGYRTIMPSILDYKRQCCSAEPDELQNFAVEKLNNPRLANLLVDAILFEQLYGILQFWFCYLCGCFFEDGDAFTMHLKEKHFPLISQCQGWPLLYQKDQVSEFIRDTLDKMVWEPINVKRAIQQFYTLCLDSELGGGMGFPEEVKWPLSDDVERRQLLNDLGQILKTLASSEAGLSLLSSGSLERMISVASWHMLLHLSPRDHRLLFTRRLANSPLSFCFLDKESLTHFVRVANRMRQLVEIEDCVCDSTVPCIWNEAPGTVRSHKINKKDSPQLVIFHCMPDYFSFLLKPAHDDDESIHNHESIHSWFDEELSDMLFDGPLHRSKHSPSFFTLISTLSGACWKLMEIMGEMMSCFNDEVLSVAPKTTYYSTVREWLDEAIVKKSGLDVENIQFSEGCAEAASDIMRIDYLSKTDSLSLRVVELLCLLESWKFKVRRLCNFDFRAFILPLMQRFFQKSSELVRADGLGYRDSNYDNSASSWTGEANNSGFFFCVHESDIMQVTNKWMMKLHLRDATSYMRFRKTWQYWYCYYCQERFGDRASHMKHLDKSHALGILFNTQIGLVPRAATKQEIDRLLGLDWMTVDSPLKTLLHSEEDQAEKHSILTRMKELLYSVLEKTPVFFSASSHLIHLAEFARVEFFRNLSDKMKLAIAREIDDSSQLIFSMFDACCLRRVYEFLENLCENCNHFQMQIQGSDDDVAHATSCGVIYANCFLQFDPAEFFNTYSLVKAVKKGERLDALTKIEEDIASELHRLMWFFDEKSIVLRKLDVGFALDRILIGESDRTETLKRRYGKIESMDAAAKTSFQYQLMSQVICESSYCTIEEALENEKNELLSQLDSLDLEIMHLLAQINKMKRKMSDLSFCDYRTDILPLMEVFLKPIIEFDAKISPWASTNLQGLLSSIDCSNLLNEPTYFKITSISVGKVLVYMKACKLNLGFEYKGMRLDFEGKWSSLLQGQMICGYVNFSGFHACRSEDIKAKAEVFVFIGDKEKKTRELAPSLKEAVCAKLLKFEDKFVEEKMSPCSKEKKKCPRHVVGKTGFELT